MEHAVPKTPPDVVPVRGVRRTLEDMVEQMIARLAITMDELQQTCATLRGQPHPGPWAIKAGRSCPQCREYVTVIDDAIKVIAGTKTAFKSRALSDLRLSLERVRHEACCGMREDVE